MKYFTNSFPSREIILNGEKHLYFGGTSYLGLQTDKAFQEIFINNVRRYGTNYGASRKSNVQLPIFEKSEQYLAELAGSQACVTLSSGYLAGQFISQYFNTPGHQCFYAPNTHSALHQKSIEPYISFTELGIALKKHLESNKKSLPVVYLDSIDFSGTNYPNFSGLQSLPLHKIILIVDDSHGVGVIGKNGGGVYQKLKTLNPKELIVSCSLGKGYGVQAGAIFGTEDKILKLKETQFFGGASPASPAGLATIIESKGIFAEKRKILKGNIQFFLDNLKNSKKLTYMKGHPAFSFSDENLVKKLENKNILVTSFRYPNEQSNLMSRIVISAAHKKEDIEKILACLGS